MINLPQKNLKKTQFLGHLGLFPWTLYGQNQYQPSVCDHQQYAKDRKSLDAF